jgi:hypothetical protein
MTLGNMCSLGVCGLAVSCPICHHESRLDVDAYPDYVKSNPSGRVSRAGRHPDGKKHEGTKAGCCRNQSHGTRSVLLFCAASGTSWEHAGITGETVTAIPVRGLFIRDAARRLSLTDRGRSALRTLLLQHGPALRPRIAGRCAARRAEGTDGSAARLPLRTVGIFGARQARDRAARGRARRNWRAVHPSYPHADHRGRAADVTLVAGQIGATEHALFWRSFAGIPESVS